MDKCYTYQEGIRTEGVDSIPKIYKDSLVQMSRIQNIKNILTEKFNPSELIVEDFTMEHRGHAGQGGGSETHFRVKIKSEEFDDTSLLTAHRKIQDELKAEFTEGLHALEIQIL